MAGELRAQHTPAYDAFIKSFRYHKAGKSPPLIQK